MTTDDGRRTTADLLTTDGRRTTDDGRQTTIAESAVRRRSSVVGAGGY